jgi:hypothetical protein
VGRRGSIFGGAAVEPAEIIAGSELGTNCTDDANYEAVLGDTAPAGHPDDMQDMIAKVWPAGA